MTELYIGTTAGGTIAFSALTTPVKEPAMLTFYPYAQTNETAGGTVSTRGNSYCEMEWNSITRPERDQLRTFCPGASSTVYVYLPTNDTAKTFDLFSLRWSGPCVRSMRGAYRVTFCATSKSCFAGW